MGIVLGKCLRSRMTNVPSDTISPADKEETTKKLKHTKRQLNLYIKKVEARIQTAKQKAIEAYKAKDTKEALKQHKLMKLHQKNANNIYGMVTNIQKSLSEIDNSTIDSQIYDALNSGNALITQLQDNADINEMHEVKEEIKSSVEYNNRLADIFSPSKEEDSQYSKELENMEAEEVQEEIDDPNMKVPTAYQKEIELPETKEIQVEMPQEDKNDKLMGTA